MVSRPQTTNWGDEGSKKTRGMLARHALIMTIAATAAVKATRIIAAVKATRIIQNLERRTQNLDKNILQHYHHVFVL